MMKRIAIAVQLMFLFEQNCIITHVLKYVVA